MKKVLKFYVLVWAIAVALFNAIVFIVPDWTNQEKFTPSFWFGYALIMVAFVGHLACAIFALKGDDLQKSFYRLPTVRTSFIGLVLTLVIGCILMLVAPVAWLGGILSLVVLAVNAVMVIRTLAAANVVGAVDDEVRVKTYFIRTLTVDAESLMARAQDPEIRAECKKVYEAVRYSDPMSHERLVDCEHQIQMKFQALTNAVVSNNVAAVKNLAFETVDLIGVRERHCKFLK